MKHLLILPLPLALFLGGGGQEPAPVKRAPEPSLRLELAPAKSTFDEHEPILVRVWLVNPGPTPCTVVQAHLSWSSSHPTSWSRRQAKRDRWGRAWLSARDGGAIPDAALVLSQRIYLFDSRFKDSDNGAVGIGGGSPGPRAPVYWHVPAGGRIPIRDLSCWLGWRKLRQPDGSVKNLEVRPGPGIYRVDSLLRSNRPDRPAAGEKAKADWQICRPLEAKASCTVRVVRSTPTLRRKLHSLAKIKLGASREAFDRVLGSAWAEVSKTRFTARYGSVGVLKVTWKLNDLVTSPSVYPWGRIDPPEVTAEFAHDSGGLIRLVGSHYGSRAIF